MLLNEYCQHTTPIEVLHSDASVINLIEGYGRNALLIRHFDCSYGLEYQGACLPFGCAIIQYWRASFFPSCQLVMNLRHLTILLAYVTLSNAVTVKQHV
jgi:hypothetical protein